MPGASRGGANHHRPEASREEYALVPGVVPTNQRGRAAILAFDGEDQRVAIVFADIVTDRNAVPPRRRASQAWGAPWARTAPDRVIASWVR